MSLLESPCLSSNPNPQHPPSGLTVIAPCFCSCASAIHNSFFTQLSVFHICTSNQALPLLKLFPWLPLNFQIQIPCPGLQGLMPCQPSTPSASITGLVVVLRHSKLSPPQGHCICPFLCLECSFSVPVTGSFSLFRFHHQSQFFRESSTLLA